MSEQSELQAEVDRLRGELDQAEGEDLIAVKRRLAEIAELKRELKN